MNPLLATAAYLGLSPEPVGSRRSVVPPPADTDDDWLVIVNLEQLARLYEVAEESQDPNRKPSMGDSDTPHFTSMRNGEVNLICTTKPDFYRRFMLAQGMCEHLNLPSKADRIAVFRAFLYRENPSLRCRVGRAF